MGGTTITQWVGIPINPEEIASSRATESVSRGSIDLDRPSRAFCRSAKKEVEDMIKQLASGTAASFEKRTDSIEEL